MAPPPSTESEPIFLHAMDQDHLTDLQSDFILSIRAVERDDDGELRKGDALRNKIVDLYTPSMLFCKELLRHPALHQSLLTLLLKREVSIPIDSTQRSVINLAQGLYVDSGATSVAVRFVHDYERTFALNYGDMPVPTSTGSDGRSRGRGRSPRRSAQASEGGSQHGGGDTNKDDVRASRGHHGHAPGEGDAGAHEFGIDASDGDRNSHVAAKAARDVSVRFKDERAKFGGTKDQWWPDFVSTYNLVCRDYALSPRLKLQFLHNLLTGAAKVFLLDKVLPVASTYEDAVDHVHREYHPVVQQEQMKNDLSNLRVSYLVGKGMTVDLALVEVYKRVSSRSRMVPAAYQGEEHRVAFLRGAVIGYTWAAEPLSRIATHNLSFQQLYAELSSSLSLSRESANAVARDRILSGSGSVADDSADIMFQGQGQYSMRNHGVGNRAGAIQGATTAPRFDPLTIMGCFNCDDPKHTINNCPKPKNTLKAAKRRAEYLLKRKESQVIPTVSRVLWELCTQFDAHHEPAVTAARDGPEGADDDLLGGSSDGGNVGQEFFAALTGKQVDSESHLEAYGDSGSACFVPRD